MNQHQVPNLNTLKPKQLGVITKLNVNKELENRLMALGLRVGKEIELVRRAIFAGPLQIRVGTTEVMLRRQDAKNIEILPLEASLNANKSFINQSNTSKLVDEILPSLNNTGMPINS